MLNIISIITMSEEKFTPSYFEINYHIGIYNNTKNVIFRNQDSSGECQAIKEKCLRACFTHFTKDDFKNVKNISDHFTTNNKKLARNTITRCCCSQHQEDGIMHALVTHKKTNISFIVGKDCFSKLFYDADDVITFWKEQCKFCNNIVAKTNINRENFCNQSCVRNYEIQERKKRLQKVYLKCVECNAPKKNENQQKWALCYNCKIKEDEEDMLRTPNNEIYGYASSDDDDQLFIGSLSIS